MMGAMTVVLSMTTVNVAFLDIMGAFGIGREDEAVRGRLCDTLDSAGEYALRPLRDSRLR